MKQDIPMVAAIRIDPKIPKSEFESSTIIAEAARIAADYLCEALAKEQK